MSDYKSLFKHSRNYLFATMATKALSFISIPIYTRILTVEDYGIVNVFMSLVSIVSVLLTLSTEVSISRYYYDAKDTEDFKKFVGTSIRLTSIIILATTTIFILGLNVVADIVDMPSRLTLSLIPVALFNITNSIFIQIYNPQMQSKKIAIVSSVQCYSAFIFSIICILLIREEKYYGYIYGNIIAMILMGAYMIRQIKPFFTNCFEKQYLPYILKYCLPYIPDALSGIVLAQFSKIYIGNNQGFAQAGSYGLVVNMATLMIIVVQITNRAWVPYYFRYMNEKDHGSIRNDFNLIWRITLIAAIGLSFFGKEIADILAKKDFLDMMPLLPLLVSGYVFHQWAYVYLRNVGYSKRMMWNTYSYMFSGVSLVILNVLLVPKYQGYGAAIATLTSYILLLVFTYMVNKYVINLFAPSFISSMKPFLVYMIFVVIACYMYTLNINWLIVLLLKIILFLICSVVLAYPFIHRISPYIKKF